MLYKRQHYNPLTVYGYLDQKRKRNVIELQKQIANIDARMSDIKLAWIPVKTWCEQDVTQNTKIA